MSVRELLYTLLQIYSYLVILYIILDWVILAAPQQGGLRTARHFLSGIVEPALYPIRRALRPYTRDLPIDFSPMVLLLLITVVQRLLLRLIPF